MNLQQKILPEPQVSYHVIDDGAAGQRIDNFLLKIAKNVPKSHIYQILRSGQVRVNKARVDASYRLCLDDKIRVPPLRMGNATIMESAPNMPTTAMNLPIIYEDADLLVINKPSGIAVHGGSGLSYGVIEILRWRYPKLKFLELVHRLDRGTSGILLLAKKRAALLSLHEQLRSNFVIKHYTACVFGNWPNDHEQSGHTEKQYRNICLPLLKYYSKLGERRVRVDMDGKKAHTIISNLKNFSGYSLVDAEPKTGRTHQIRVHLAHCGYPILGDDKYGNFAINDKLSKSSSPSKLQRMFLHASSICFMHPSNKVKVYLKLDLPQECQFFLKNLAPIKKY